ncbi:phage holin family protein [Methylococcus mesophilus]|uniref:phage holin family protein n=1 Tax=Methylococcus mesophilus TaxID=2993564 RepID=UPI00224B3E15|nr:phage holin family protein [Methylococcus mesophilus]UZR29082.1 hypothetical protein OOT43_00215 [Methylococcus mesophilus]
MALNAMGIEPDSCRPSGPIIHTVIAMQVVFVAVWSGLVAYFNRVRERRDALNWLFGLIDIASSALVGFSVWLIAERQELGYCEAMLLAIVAGHFGARWFGLLMNRWRGP